MAETRILLTADDFEALVSGEIIEQNGVKVALQDTGYSFMVEIINDKYNKLYVRK